MVSHGSCFGRDPVEGGAEDYGAEVVETGEEQLATTVPSQHPP